MTRLLILFLLFGVIALIVLIAVYNGLVYRRNRVRQAYNTIDLNLRKRFDLIPALVEIVKGVALHEAETFTQLVEAHERLDRGNLNPAERFQINNVVESFPSNVIAGTFGFQRHDFFEADLGIGGSAG